MKKWNVGQVLKRADERGFVSQLPDGWTLLPAGLDELRDKGVPLKAKLIADATHNLHAHIASITDPIRRAFVQESVEAFEANLNRAAVVLSWVGAVWILQNHVLSNSLKSFNTALVARFAKAKPVKTIKNFVPIGEADFLQVCEDAGIIDKAEKKQLTQRLDLRNDCGHPNNLTIGDHQAASHLESLLQNVYEKY
jgi:hypothetical protein